MQKWPLVKTARKKGFCEKDALSVKFKYDRKKTNIGGLESVRLRVFCNILGNEDIWSKTG